MGSVWVAPLARSLMESFGLQTTMFYLGIGMLIAVVGFAQFIKNPPENFIPEGEESQQTITKNTNKDYSIEDTVRTWQFYVIWIVFAFGSGAGLMIIGNLASIVKDQIGLPAFSAIAVSALAIGNGGGRVLYGILSDKIGRRNTLMIAFVMQAFLIGGLFFAGSESTLANVPVLTGFCSTGWSKLRRQSICHTTINERFLRRQEFSSELWCCLHRLGSGRLYGFPTWQRHQRHIWQL